MAGFSLRSLTGVLMGSLLYSGSAMADSGPLLWHSENVQLLRGSDYELGDNDRTIVTFEHASGWSWGDVFVFADFTAQDNGDRNAYGEISPRLSLSRLAGGQPSDEGLIRDTVLTVTYERGDEGLERYLAGAGVDLNLPGFRFFRVHGYHRDDPERDGSTWQATVIWNRPFEIGDQSFLTEGFADIAGAEGWGVANQLYVPRLLWDAGANFGRPDEVFLGVEWQHWNNKFGVDGVTESVVQAQIKWVFN